MGFSCTFSLMCHHDKASTLRLLGGFRPSLRLKLQKHRDQFLGILRFSAGIAKTSKTTQFVQTYEKKKLNIPLRERPIGKNKVGNARHLVKCVSNTSARTGTCLGWDVMKRWWNHWGWLASWRKMASMALAKAMVPKQLPSSSSSSSASASGSV